MARRHVPWQQHTVVPLDSAGGCPPPEWVSGGRLILMDRNEVSRGDLAASLGVELYLAAVGEHTPEYYYPHGIDNLRVPVTCPPVRDRT